MRLELFRACRVARFVVPLSTQFRAVIRPGEHVYAKCECPTSDVAEVSGSLVVEFAGQPRGVFIEPSREVGDAFLHGVEFLQNGIRGVVLKDRPGVATRFRATPKIPRNSFQKD